MVFTGCNSGESKGSENYGDYVDLGLSSGTLWKSYNENGLFSHYDAMNQFGKDLPTEEQLRELMEDCVWSLNNGGYTVKGPNGNSIWMSLQGGRQCAGNVTNEGEAGYYWGSNHTDNEAVYLAITIDHGTAMPFYLERCQGFSVRLVKKK